MQTHHLNDSDKNLFNRRKFIKLAGTAAAGLALTPWQAIALDKPAQKKPNILLIMADDLGYSDLGCFGSEIRTPHLDALAGNGMRYTRMYNCAKCQPSRASLLTGRYALNMSSKPLKTNPNIGMLLQKSGYTTLWAGKSHLVHNPVKSGFDHFYGFNSGITNYWNPSSTGRDGKPIPTLGNTQWRDDATVMKPYRPKEEDFYATDALTTKALGWLDESAKNDKPWFLYMAYNAPHWPLHAPKDEVEKYKGVYEKGYQEIRKARFDQLVKAGIIDPKKGGPAHARLKDWSALSEKERRSEINAMSVYAAMITRMDSNIGRLIDKVKARGELNNTLVLFFSDNGASGERLGRIIKSTQKKYTPTGKEVPGSVMTYGFLGPNWGQVANTPLRGCKLRPDEGGICSPMIAHWPSVIKKGSPLCREPLHLVDIVPTLMAIAGGTYPEKYKGKPARKLVDGRDFSMTFKGEPFPEERNLFFSYGGSAVVNKRWKARKHRKGWRLYDLSANRNESKNVGEKHPEILKRMVKEWEQYHKSHQ